MNIVAPVAEMGWSSCASTIHQRPVGAAATGRRTLLVAAGGSRYRAIVSVRPIRAVCFDFQDTLATFRVGGPYGLYVEAAAALGIAVSESELLMDTTSAWAEYQTPLGPDHAAYSTDEETFLGVRAAVHARRLRAAGVEAEAAEQIGRRIDILEADPGRYELFPDTLPALDRLAQAGVQAVVVSNHIWRLPEVVRGLGLAAKLEGVITSARVGYRKPHPNIFRAALRLTGTAPGDTLMVGDSVRDDVEGALAVGMRAALLDRAGRHRPVAGASVIRSLLDIPLA
jgi:HAD superfamily hydrolase (TIGR01509 family)